MKIQPQFCSISICVCGSKCAIHHQFEEVIKSYLLGDRLNERVTAKLTLCAVFQQRLSHLKPQ